MSDTARTYQDLMSELDAYEPSVTAEAITTARAIAERLHHPALAVMADDMEARN